MKYYTLIFLCFLLCISIAAPVSVSAAIIFVDKNTTGSETGMTWFHAYKHFQDGLDDAEPGDEIWVAKGRYLPDTEHGGSGPEYYSFQMKNSVRIFGGFDPASGDILFKDRDWKKNEVILSGDIGYTDWDGDNALHVFYHPDSLNLNTSAVLDGVTVSHGFARAAQANGGGMLNIGASPTITNCTFRDNKATNGAGMCNDLYSEPVITHTSFIDNTCKSDGGGMVNYTGADAQVDACLFIGNKATDPYSDGGGMRNHDCQPLVTNTLFLYNRADFGGGAMNSPLINTNINPVFINCTFFGNFAGIEGGGMYNYVLPTRIANCIFLENTPESIAQFDNRDDVNATFSDIQMSKAPFPGTGNINLPPLFHNIPVFLDYTIEDASPKELVVADASIYTEGDVIETDNDGILRKILKISDNIIIIKPELSGNSEKGMQIKNWKNAKSQTEDFHISKSSPCVDTGSNIIKGLPSDDFEHEDRMIDGDEDAVKTADMGMDEFNPDAIIYVDHDAAGANIGTNWNNAFTDLQDALDIAESGNQIWVAEGTYTPSETINPSNSRTAAFQLKNGVALYGGFDPDTGDTEFPDRDGAANPTILSGEIGSPSTTSDNSFHVFYHPPSLGLNQTAVLDGFFIEKGHADDGGYIDINQQGGGMYNNGCSPTIRNCHFRTNWAVFGGGIYNENNSPHINDCTFSDNHGTYGGGMYNTNAVFTMSDCLFGSDSQEGNSAAGSGGGMYIAAGSDITTTGCLFRNNSAQSGGGIYCSEASLILTNTDMLYNECDTHITGEGRGAGIYMINTSANFNDLSISHNFAYRMGGGIYGEQSTPVLHNVLLDSNRAQNGGGLYFDHCDGRMDGSSTIENNTLLNPENGGGIYLCNGTVTEFDGITISGNSADDSDSFGGGVYCNNASPVFINCHITGNTSGNAGGGIAVFNESAPDFQGCFIDTNDAVFEGGGIFIKNSDPVLSDCSISQNKVTHANDSYGGGMACFAGSPSLTDCTLDRNSATAVGGGILVDGNDGPALPVLTRCTIRNNTVSSTAGGFASGGGMFIAYDAAPVLNDCTFDSNTALGGYSDSGGGGIYNNRAAVTMTGCTFNDNQAEKSGGAVYSTFSSRPIRIIHTQFTGNRANDGKGGAYYGLSDMIGSYFNLCQFESNSGVNGGGMYLSRSNNDIVNSIFKNNAAISGGGLMVNNESDPIHITGSLFTDNLATSGGAMYLSQATPYIQSCTIVGNDITDSSFAVCGGVLNDDASPVIGNSIIYGNDSAEIHNLGSSIPSITWSDIQGGYGTGSDHNLNTNPRLDIDFRLRSDSPLIGAGNNSLLPADITDVDNDADTTEKLPIDIFLGQRITNTIDMGADEFEPDSGCVFDDNNDGDVDGSDLAVFINGPIENMAEFASEFGNTDCSGS